MITYIQALILGLLQGVSELFPVSSLGHSVLVAWLFNWHGILANQAQSEAFFLSFLVALHVATGLALLIFYRDIWWRIATGFCRSVGRRQIDSPDGQLAWLLITATVPAGLVALVLQDTLRAQFAKPLSAMIFLFINGCILLIGDRYLKHSPKTGQGRRVRKATGNTGHSSQSQVTVAAATAVTPSANSQARASTAQNVSQALTLPRAAIIGVAQVGALFAGISRSGITMVSGLYSGLNHEDAARFSFLLATPIIFAAGIFSLPDFFSNFGPAVRGQILVGAVAAGLAAYAAVRYLDRYFRDKTLRPFGLYCVGISLAMLLLGVIRGHF
jgi:undecaprenyl-diphosphatase